LFVVATAGHIDHGKSTLVRALTGMEPDRWAEERRRGMTLDLGFAGGRLAAARGRIFRPGSGPVFSPDVQASLDQLKERLDAHPFDAPDAGELGALNLTRQALAAAAGLKLFLRLPGDILVHPAAADMALAILSELPQPFTASDARQALGVTRRVALPPLEHLDDRGLTGRVDSTSRQVTSADDQ
jgi:selenocysteine-specific elongation factor